MPILFIQITCWIFALIGLVLLSVSLQLYYKRTHDKLFFRRLWLRRELLTAGEYALNRIGFWLAIVAVVVAYAQVIFVRYVQP